MAAIFIILGAVLILSLAAISRKRNITMTTKLKQAFVKSTMGPYRSSSIAINDSEAETEKRRANLTLEDILPQSELKTAKPVMLESGQEEWFDLGAVAEEFKISGDDGTALFRTRKNNWIELIGTKYFKINEQQAMKWLCKYRHEEFAKRGGWNNAKEV